MILNNNVDNNLGTKNEEEMKMNKQQLQERFDFLLDETSSMEYWVEIGDGARHISPEDYHAKMDVLHAELREVENALEELEQKEEKEMKEFDYELAALLLEVNNHEMKMEVKAKKEKLAQLKDFYEQLTSSEEVIEEESSVFSMKRGEIIQDEPLISAEEIVEEVVEESSTFSFKKEDIIQDDFYSTNESVHEDVNPETDNVDDRGKFNDLKDEAEIAFEKSSRVIRGKVNKGVSVAKKAEKKFGKFMGEFLVKSAMKGARK